MVINIDQGQYPNLNLHQNVQWTSLAEGYQRILKADVCSSDAVDCVRLEDIRIGEDPNVDFENSDELDSFLNRFIAETKQKEV